MSELIPNDAVKAIQDGVETATIEVGGNTFTTRQVFLPPAEPQPKTLQLHTLTGLAEFVNSFDKSQIACIHIKDAANVWVCGKIDGRHNERAYFAQAVRFSNGKFPFCEYLDQESFIIAVQTCFVPSDARAKLLALVGNLVDEAVNNQHDNGVTQKVTTRRGISMVGAEEVPNPVNLAPYRTFPEIDQPESPFVLRVQKGCQVALFETRNCQWELDAIQGIAEFLKSKIQDVTIIA